jgi:hypothetical protein
MDQRPSVRRGRRTDRPVADGSVSIDPRWDSECGLAWPDAYASKCYGPST